ncbi:MFS transporter [Klebsiella pneumoniae]|uniref:MFS transporter n=1 Tax=Klebsiella pneumoniae TaxID=573 RepID=UPI00217EF8D9|nr:MFS transporter [Klebsiella pneumoniae]MCS5811171.1 MFS transporter [Klebsiella pneumoniae subsp. pneumoniae]
MERTKSSYFALACLCAFAVANIYYNQPLLELFAKDFAVDEKHAGSVAMFVQLSYAAGLVFFVPLGDRFERRKLLIILLGINAAASAAASFTQTIGQLLTVNIVIGMTSVGAQIVIPMVSLIAPAEQRGRAVGTVMSGLMAGVLFGRILSGFVGNYFGWRSMYLVATTLDLFLLIMVPRLLPHSKTSASQIPYHLLLKSLITFFIKEGELRLSCFCGAMMFGGFSALWGGLAFLLARPPYHYGSDIVGSFGFAGIAGILATPYIGKMADRYSPRIVVLVGSVIALLGFISVFFSPHYLFALIFALVLLDIGGRAGLVGNQLRALALSAEGRSRLNTVFMCSYFIGGAVGTRAGAEISVRYGWTGITVMGFILSCFVLFLNIRHANTNKNTDALA